MLAELVLRWFAITTMGSYFAGKVPILNEYCWFEADCSGTFSARPIREFSFLIFDSVFRL
jgi:hypothetical protein